MENRSKDKIWVLSLLLSLARCVRRIYPVFLEFTYQMENRVLFQGKKMENRVEDSIWKLRVLFTCSMDA